MLENPSADFGVSDTEVDDLLSKAEAGNGPAIIDDEPEAAAIETKEAVTQVPAAKAVTPPTEQEFEFVHNGTRIKAPLSKIIKWAQQGYDYPTKMAELNKQRETIQKMETTYKPIDEWVSKNQDKWEKLRSVIHAEQQGLGELPPQVLQTLHKYDEAFQRLEEERKQTKYKAEDDKLASDIKSIRDKYKDLDWDAADESGRNREFAVLNHAAQNGFPTFKAAFLDLYHDDLLKIAETKAKESLAAAKERDTKKGLLPSNTTKAAPQLKTVQSKGKHYPTGTEILEELGIS